MGTKAAANPLRSPPPQEREDEEREDDDRSKRLTSVGQAVEVLHVLDLALACTNDEELGRLASQIREGERALESWAREVETFRASKQLFEAGIVPDLAERPRDDERDELVLARMA